MQLPVKASKQLLRNPPTLLSMSHPTIFEWNLRWRLSDSKLHNRTLVIQFMPYKNSANVMTVGVKFRMSSE